MKNYLIGSNNYALLASYILSDITIIPTSKFEANNVEPEFLPNTPEIINIVNSLGLKYKVKILNAFFDDRGKISTVPSDSFKNVYALSTRGKLAVENSYFEKFKGSMEYISIKNKGPFESFYLLFKEIKKNIVLKDMIDSEVDSISVKNSNIILSDGNILEYKRLIWTGDIKNLDKKLNLFTKKIYVYVCEYNNEADKKMSNFFSFGYSIGKTYFRTIYLKDKIEYHCMKRTFKDEIDGNKIINSFTTDQIVDNLRKTNMYNIDLISMYSQWNLGYSISQAYRDCKELYEYYNLDKKIGDNIFKSQQNLLY